MNIKYIFIVLGEPYSEFSEILGKYFSKTKVIKKKIVVFGNINLFKHQLIKLNYKINLNEIKHLKEAKINKINIIDINFVMKDIFSKISNKSNKYIEE